MKSLMIDFDQDIHIPKPQFKYLNMWTQASSFYLEVKKVLEKVSRGTKQFVMMAKLRNLQKTLRALHNSNFPDVVHKEHEVRSALACAQEALTLDTNNTTLAS